MDESRRCCPVCKSACSVPTVVPIYVRNEPSTPLGSAKKSPQEDAADDDKRDSEEEEEEKEAATGNEEGIEQETTENSNVEGDSSSSLNTFEREETPSPETTNATTGLRQRLRFRSRDSEIPEIPLDDIPSRPAASSPARPSRSSMAIEQRRPEAQAYAAARPPLSPHQASLSHGMLLMFQQAMNASDHNTTNDSGGTQQQQRGVPRLHRTSGDEDTGFGNDANNNQNNVDSPRDDATEFLSRLILILASFVILCLLLF